MLFNNRIWTAPAKRSDDGAFSRANLFAEEKRCGAPLPTALQTILLLRAKLLVANRAAQECVLSVNVTLSDFNDFACRNSTRGAPSHL
ncbi:MAG: hypothetical protein DMF23_06255 [Verrucomicrobia bacterium]|nr:MAG: hypothetical protein DMF23_06255 [Verrucomicrobiota bacterium]